MVRLVYVFAAIGAITLVAAVPSAFDKQSVRSGRGRIGRRDYVLRLLMSQGLRA